jgi:glycosyltransferase domain-containing protein
VETCVRRYPHLRIVLDLHPHPTPFVEKLVRTLRRVNSRFVMLQAQDDFPVPDGVEACVEYLQDHPDFSVARGRVARFFLGRGADPSSAVNLTLLPHPMRSYLEESPVDRVVDHLNNYASTLYSVHRTESLLQAFEYTAAHSRHVIFFQYLSSALTVIEGKVWCGQKLFYVRQNHVESWGAKAKREDRDHWPRLLVAPDYSARYVEFRAALAQALAVATGAPAQSLHTTLDDAAVQLIVRSLGGRALDDADESLFMGKLKTAGTPERTELENIVQFVTRYPDTF